MGHYKNLSELFDVAADTYGDKIALQQMDSSDAYVAESYRDLYDLKRKIGAYLAKKGLKRGDHIAVIGSNCPLWVAITAGIFHIGATLVPIDKNSSRDEINHILSASESKLVFTQAQTLADTALSTIESVLFSELRTIVNTLSVMDAMVLLDERPSQREAGPNDLALLVYTSGTTGVSKGVMLTHKNILSNLEAIKSRIPLEPTDSILSILPLSHMFEFTAGTMYPLLSGSTITYLRSLKGSEIIKNMQRSSTTVMVVVPRILSLLQGNIVAKMKKLSLWKQNLICALGTITPFIKPLARVVFKRVHKEFGGSIRFFVTGGAPVHKDTLWFFEKLGIPVLQGYGLTETSPVLSATSPLENHIGTTGKPLSNVQIKIDGPDSASAGEILAKGPAIMKGYYKDADSTSLVMDGEWFRTGDVGYIDNTGALVICGRIKALIITGAGKNIYPEELEKVFSRSPLIEEICVVSTDDGKGGERPYAFIVPSSTRDGDREMIKKDISCEISELSASLSTFKHLAGWEIREKELPKTATQKVKRYLLQRLHDDSRRTPRKK